MSTAAAGVFSPQVGAVVSATLQASGAAQVLFASEGDYTFSMAGTSSALFAGAAVASGQMAWNATSSMTVQAGAFASADLLVESVAFPAFGGAAMASGAFYAGSEALVDFHGAARYATLPRSQDYVIRAMELRGIGRPAEVRTASVPDTPQSITRPAEQRVAIYQ